MDCVNCGAPLPAKSHICGHCKTLNDVDLRALELSAAKGPATDRKCPRCETQMESIAIVLKESMYVERCKTCLGIFFDPGELEHILDDSDAGVFEANHERIQKLIEEEYRDIVEKVRYVKCPVCGDLMNRRNFGARSGVVVDTCRKHGVWLDGGELGQILKWAKAGGRIHHAEKREKDAAADQRRKRQDTMLDAATTSRNVYDHPHHYVGAWGLAGLLRVISRWL